MNQSLLGVLLLAAFAHAKLYILEFKHPSGSDSLSPEEVRDGIHVSAVKSQHTRFTEWLASHPENLSNTVALAPGYSPYTHVFSGVVIDVLGSSTQAVKALKAFDEVKTLHSVNEIASPSFEQHPLPTQEWKPPPVVQKRDQESNKMTGVYGYSESTGKNVTVCTIDTGVDYNHPDLGGCFGPNCKVAFGYDFAGDAFNPPKVTTPSPKQLPMDCAGHGSHVAGIITAVSANKSHPLVQGVAPDVKLGAYKVFGCTGGTNSALIVAALEQAFKDSCDVVNLSLGSTDQVGSAPETISADKFAQLGMVIVVSAGNSQNLGAFRLGSPAVADGVITVGSVENIKSIGRTLSVAGDAANRQLEFTYMDKPPTAAANGQLKTNQSLSTTAEADGCKKYPDNFFAGYIALIRRGGCTFAQKASNAIKANASTIIFFNNAKVDETIGGVAQPYKNLTVFTISRSSGEYLVNMLKARGNGNVTIVFNQTDTLLPSPIGGRINSFSSWGFTLSWHIKPDLVAPGGHVYSTFPLSLGGYAVLSGTSMASPHAAGVFALVLSNLKSRIIALSRQNIIYSLVKTTSVPALFPNSDNLHNVLAPVALQGSGLVNIENITEATTFIYPSSVSAKVSPWRNYTKLGEPDIQVFKFQVSNLGFNNRSYSLGYTEAAYVSVDDPTNPTLYAPISNSSLYTVFDLPSKFTLGVNESVIVTFSIRGPTRKGMEALQSNSSAWLYSGWVKCTDDLGKIYSIAYGGSVGDYYNFTAIDTVKHTPFLSANSNRNVTSLHNHINITFPLQPLLLVPSANGTATQDYLLINFHLQLPSIQTAVYVFPSTIDPAAAESAAFSVFPATFLNSTIAEMATFVQTIEATLLGMPVPKGCIAMSQPISISGNDADNSLGNLYTVLAWDGSVNFNGGTPVPAGDYFVVIVSESLYGEYADVTVWSSPSFQMYRSYDAKNKQGKLEKVIHY